MPVSSSVFQKIAAASANTGGNFIKQGRYVLEVLKLLLENKNNGATFIAELIVRESQAITDDEKPNAVGQTVSYVQLLEKHKSAPGNTKAFVLSLMGEAESEVSGDDFIQSLKYLTNDDPNAKDDDGTAMPVQPGKGMLLACETYRKAKKEKPTEIMTLPRWTTVVQSDEDIAKRRAAQVA